MEENREIELIFNKLHDSNNKIRTIGFNIMLISLINILLLFGFIFSFNSFLLGAVDKILLRDWSQFTMIIVICIITVITVFIYRFLHLRREIKIIISEIEDEFGWYKPSGIGETGTEKSQKKLTVDQRIEMRNAARNIILPFFNEENDVFYYFIINFFSIICILATSILVAYQYRYILN